MYDVVLEMLAERSGERDQHSYEEGGAAVAVDVVVVVVAVVDAVGGAVVVVFVADSDLYSGLEDAPHSFYVVANFSHLLYRDVFWFQQLYFVLQIADFLDLSLFQNDIH